VFLFSAVFRANVTATDLPSVIPLIEKNVQANMEAIRDAGGSCLTKVLDWTERSFDFIQADYILLADCVYYEQVNIPIQIFNQKIIIHFSQWSRW